MALPGRESESHAHACASQKKLGLGMMSTRRFDPGRAVIAAEVVDDLPQMFFTSRTRRGKSLRMAASEIGCSHTILGRLENGALPNGPALLRILRWIGEDK
jgi:hypothetical protein